MRARSYLGDGVYAEIEHSDLVLTTENGVRVTNRVVLEPEVFLALMRFVREHLGIELSPSLRG